MRRRLPLVPAVLTALSVAAVVAGATVGTGTAVPAPELMQNGHWAVSAEQGAVLHVHGGTGQVDARVELPGEAAQGGLMSVAGGDQGFVVGQDRIWTFDQATLTVVATAAAPGLDAAPEVPVPIEVVGGPYLVYRQAGAVARLGRPPVVTMAGGPLGPPVRTSDGTVWVHRADTGELCALRRGALELDRPARTRSGAPGGLTVVQDVATFVDTGTDTAHRVTADGLGAGAPLGTDLPDDALLGDQAAGTRLPVVLPGVNTLRLVDLAAGRPPADVPLGPGTFSAPLVNADSIALIDLATHRLLTFGADGAPRATTQLPEGSSADDLTRGEDGRIYLDEPGGGRTHVVQPDGSVTSVDLGGGAATGPAVAAAPRPDQLAPVTPPPAGQVFVPVPDVLAAPGVPRAGPAAVGDDPGAVALPPGAAPPPGLPPGRPPPPGAVAPGAPTGVQAVLTGPAEITVSWNPVPGGGLPVQYSVSSGANHAVAVAPQTVVTGQAPAVFAGLVPGAYQFTVVASTAAGAGPFAVSNAVVVPAVPVVPVGPPGAPVITLAGGGQGARTMYVAPSWAQPDLNGGELVEYRVRITDGNGVEEVDTTTQDLTVPRLATDRCLQPYDVEVRAVTRAPGTGVEQVGPAGTATDDRGDCVVDMAITAEALGPDTVQVTSRILGGQDPYVSIGCALLLDGAVVWDGRCSAVTGLNGGAAVVVDGLAPGTAYDVVARLDQFVGGPTNTDTVTVTTTAG